MMAAIQKTNQELELELAQARARIAELEKCLEGAQPGGSSPAAPGMPAAKEAVPPGPAAGEAIETTSGMKAIRILLADDHAVVRDGLARLLRNEPGMEVVGQAADGLEVVQMALQLKPDIILMDVSMPYLSGVDVTRRLTQQVPGIRVIGLSMHRQEDIASAMIGAGAIAYLTKSMEPEDLVAAIRDHAGRPGAASHS
jgi:CheY-like chemotaxis protein